MTRSPLRLLLVPLAVLALAAVACSGTDDAATGTGGAETVQLLVFGSPDELDAYRSLIDAFHESQDDVRVQLVTAADRSDLLTRLSTSFAGGSPPDLFLVNYRFYGQFAAKGVLAPLDERLASSDVLAAEDFYEPPMAAFTWEGRQTCLPQNVSSLVVYYNADAFAAADVPAPEPGWTWDDMVAAARTLTVDTDGDGSVDQYGLGVEPAVIRVAPFVWSNGADIVDDPDTPTRLTFDGPEAQQVLGDFVDLYWVHQVVPSEVEYEAEDNEARFANGRMAMVMQSRRSTTYFRSITDFDWDVAPLPTLREPAGVLHSDAYCMSAASEHQDAAWRFVEFALGPQGAPVIAASGRTVPSLRSVAESPAFLDPGARPASSAVFLDTIPVIRDLPTVSTWPEIEDAADLELEIALWRVRKSPAEMAAAIDDATRDLFARAER